MTVEEQAGEVAGREPSADGPTVAGVFAEVASTLLQPAEVSDLAQRLVDACVELLGVWAAGLLVVDPGSSPKLLAASTHEAGLVELVQVTSGEGPCLAAIDRGTSVVVEDVQDVVDMWPTWAAAAAGVGVRRAYGLPLTASGRVIGALNLFRRTPEPLGTQQLEVARALADLGSVGILQHRALAEVEAVNGQLQRALDSRVVVEQAKGRLAEREGISVAEAFDRLRRTARASSTPLTEVARRVVEVPDADADGGPSTATGSA